METTTTANELHTRYTLLQVLEFRKRLLDARTELTTLHQKQRAGTLEEAGDAANESAYSTTDRSENGDSAAILADLEREFPAEANVEQTLKEIENALARLDDGSYGIDEITGEPIPIARLRALPWATMTVETAEHVP